MNKKITNNAMSAYFGLAALLLLPSKKENINHPFVKKHAKTALFIHVLMFLNYLIFISYSLLGNFTPISGYGLNHILAALIFLGLFGWLLYGVSKANNGDDFSIWDMAAMSKTDKLVELKNSNLNEQWILTIILSLVPFVGFTLKGKFKNYKSPILENNLKLNLIITFIISLFFVFSYENIGLLFVLFYTIFIVFYSILLISKGNLIQLNLEKIPTAEEVYVNSICFIQYLKWYFSSKWFIPFATLKENQKNIFSEQDKNNKEYLETLKEPKLSKYIAYIPYVNIISLIDFHSKNKFHIANGLLITLVSWILWFFGYHQYQTLLLFLVCFGFWYTKMIEYRFPILFDVYDIVRHIGWKIFSSGKKIREKQQEVQEISFSNTDV